MMMMMVMSPLERQRKGKKKRREKRVGFVSGTLMIKEELEVEERIEILETKRERELNARDREAKDKLS